MDSWSVPLALVLVLATGCSNMQPVVPGPPAPVAPHLSTPPPALAAPALPQPPARPAPPVLLVYRIGGLPAELPAGLMDLPEVEVASVVDSGGLLLRRSRGADGAVVDRPPPGYALPLEAMAFDPRTYPRLLDHLDQPLFARLRPGQALLSQTAARVRRLGSGGVLQVDGASLRVAGVVDDRILRRAEVAVTRADRARLRLDSPSVLLSYRGPPARLQARISSLAGSTATVRTRDLGRAPAWRGTPAVLPSAMVKDRFGEFAIRPSEGEGLDIDAAWVDNNIITERVPLLGAVECHRRMLPALRDALGEVERAGLARLVDPGDYAGCFSARRIAASGGVSRHAWGLAVDLNASRNPYGAIPSQDPRLVEIFNRWGFNWGGDWPTPDGMHFEYRGTG